MKKAKCPKCGNTEFARTMTEVVEIEVSKEYVTDMLVGQPACGLETEATFVCTKCKRQLREEEMKI